MRTTLLAIATTLLLSLGLLAPPGASAAVSSYVVRGHPITAPGLAQSVNYRCSAEAPESQAVPLERQGGTVGAGALGWQMSPAGSVTGPQAVVAGDPYTLSAFRTDVLASSGSTGWALVYFEDTNADGDRRQSYGWAEVSIPASGSWQTLDVTNRVYDWEVWINGVNQGVTSGTVQNYALSRPTIEQAYFHVLLGCNGAPFYLDNFTVAHDANTVGYDFEPAPSTDHTTHTTTTTHDHTDPTQPPHTMAHLEWSTNGREVKTSDRLTIAYGQSIWLLGHSHQHTDAGNQWYSGIGTMYSQPTRGAAQSLGRKGFDPKYYAAFKVSPTQETVYRFTADATGAVPAATSNQVTVFVTSRVRAAVLDRQLLRGQRLAVGGRVWPSAKGVKVTLQRRLGGSWKKLESVKTRKGGRFSVATKADSVGTWVVRVVVASTNTNLGTSTRSAKVTVKRPPRRNAPPPPPATDNTPETTTPVTTPSPTQVPSTAPTPPDRPTNTGRGTVSGPVLTSVVAGTKADGTSTDR